MVMAIMALAVIRHLSRLVKQNLQRRGRSKDKSNLHTFSNPWWLTEKTWRT
jgi:hypothetical protein